MNRKSLRFVVSAALLLLSTVTRGYAADSITHQISLPTGQTWCDDGMINGLFTQINTFRAQNNVPALKMDPLGMKVAEVRATQFLAYMATHQPGTPGFNPHEGYDTTAASLGYNIISENLAYSTTSPGYVVYAAWQDRLHIAAMLARDANVAGVSCVYSEGGTPYWTYEPGCSADFCGSSYPVPPSTPTTPPPSTTPTLDSEQWAFLDLINKYRAQNGAGPLQVSAALQNAAQWMSADMAANNYASHTDSLGRSSGTRIAAFGYTYSPWGENIAGGFSDAQTALDQWIGACDPDASGTCTYAHRKNMLNPAFVVIGIGRAYSSTSAYGWYWTTDFGGYVDQVITPGTPGTPAPSAPVISAFTASPATIVRGQSATLAWSVSGATALSIDNGIGTVSGLTSKTVVPAQTTAYKLTATNASGSTSATVTVTVNAAPPAGDTQAPSTPSITSAVAASPTSVKLAWTASTDNVGVAGYQIFRNGAALKSVPASPLSYTDSTVQANTTYSYSIRAFDAAGNQSATSAAVQVKTPVPPVSGGACPAPATNAFTGCYFNNATLSGDPAFVRTDSQINFDWLYAAPDKSIVSSEYSVRWQGKFNFDQGSYTFTTIASDGIRLYIDGSLLIDRWRDQPAYIYKATPTLTQGEHLVVVEYYERTGSPTARVSWQSNAPVGPAPVISSFIATPSTISAGQAALLSWSVSGAEAITIDNGIGAVTSLPSKQVSPAATTTYKLTATNKSGVVSASVTVAVISASGDAQAPTSPKITSAIAKSATSVDLTWTASTDNIAVAGYRILRNGAVVASAPAASLSYSDAGLTPSTTYTYSVRAYDAAGNLSAAGNSVQVQTPAGSGSGACPAPATNAFTGCYYANTGMTGTPVLVRTDNQINFDWQFSPPDRALPSAYSVRWQGNFNFDQGNYTFSAITSDGLRIYVDGVLILDRWRDQPPYMYRAYKSLTQGNHLVVVEYYEQTGSATAHVSWQKQ